VRDPQRLWVVELDADGGGLPGRKTIRPVPTASPDVFLHGMSENRDCPAPKRELEIYRPDPHLLAQGNLQWKCWTGIAWLDAGTHESLCRPPISSRRLKNQGC